MKHQSAQDFIIKTKPDTKFKKWYKKNYGLDAKEVIKTDDKVFDLYTLLIKKSMKKINKPFSGHKEPWVSTQKFLLDMSIVLNIGLLVGFIYLLKQI